MDFAQLFSKLGRGFGIVKAMQTVTSRINELRIQVTDGLIPVAEEIELERRQMKRLTDFMNDDRWSEVMDLKDRGRMEEARERAQSLRRDYDL